MKILIYGGGAVGLGIASYILNAGNPVDIIAREDSAKMLNEHGLFREGIFGNAHFTPDKFYATSNIHEMKDKFYDYILVCTKSFDSANAAKEISEIPGILSDKGILILFQNGWGNAEIFGEYFSPKIIYNARVLTGFSLSEKNHVNNTVHAETVHIGSLHNSDTAIVKPLSDMITAGGLECAPFADMESELWAKMLYNCSLNGTGAIFEVSYGKLREYPESRYIIDGIIFEIFAVMNAAGYKTKWNTAEEYGKILYEKLIPVTAEHKSSTLQDIQAGKRTEIDALNGVIVKLGNKFNVPVPVNNIIFNMVQFKSKLSL